MWTPNLVVTFWGDILEIRSLSRECRDLWDSNHVYRVCYTMLGFSRACAWIRSLQERGISPRTDMPMGSNQMLLFARGLLSEEQIGTHLVTEICLYRNSKRAFGWLREVSRNLGDPLLSGRVLRYMILHLCHDRCYWLEAPGHHRSALWWKFLKLGMGVTTGITGILEEFIEIDMLTMALYTNNDQNNSFTRAWLGRPTDPRYPWIVDLRKAHDYANNPNMYMNQLSFLTRLFLVFLAPRPDVKGIVDEYHRIGPDNWRIVYPELSRDLIKYLHDDYLQRLSLMNILRTVVLHHAGITPKLNFPF